MTGGYKKPNKRAKKETKKPAVSKLEFLEIVDDIKRNWVDIKSKALRISGFQSRNFGV